MESLGMIELLILTFVVFSYHETFMHLIKSF